jgi:hypothetical protein
VSADQDPASEDAGEVVRRAKPAFEAHDRPDHLEHVCFSGAHALDRERFDAIVGWTIQRCHGTV